MGRKTKQNISPYESPIVGYQYNPTTKVTEPVTAADAAAALGARPRTRSIRDILETPSVEITDDPFYDCAISDLTNIARDKFDTSFDKAEAEAALGLIEDFRPAKGSGGCPPRLSSTRYDLIDPTIGPLSPLVVVLPYPDLLSGNHKAVAVPGASADTLPTASTPGQIDAALLHVNPLGDGTTDYFSSADNTLDNIPEHVPLHEDSHHIADVNDEFYPPDNYVSSPELNNLSNLQLIEELGRCSDALLQLEHDDSNDPLDEVSLHVDNSNRSSPQYTINPLEQLQPNSTPSSPSATLPANPGKASLTVNPGKASPTVQRTSTPYPLPCDHPFVRAMAPSDLQAAEAIEWFARAESDWEDEYKDMTLEYLSLAELQRIREACAVHKTNLVNCYFTVSKCSPATQLQVKSLTDVQSLKKTYIGFIAKLWEQDHNTRKDAVPRPSSNLSKQSELSEEIVTERVTRRTGPATDAAATITALFTSLLTMDAKSHQDLCALEAKFESAKAQKNDVLTELKDLTKAATSSGMRDEAEQLSQSADQLHDAQRLATNYTMDARQTLGIPVGGPIRSANNVLKAPTFSGDFGGDTDYFSFMHSFKEYASTACLFSDPDRLIKLKYECLTGQAKTAIATAETFTAADTILKSLFGKPRLLFAHKERELKKVGKCPLHPLDRRNWFVMVMTQLNAIKDLAVKHNIVDSFITSSLFDTIISYLTPEDRLYYKKRIVDAMDWDEELDTSLKATVDRVMVFITKMTHRSSLEVDYAISCFDRSDDILKKMSIKGEKPKDGKKDVNKDNNKSKPAEKRKEIPGIFQTAESETTDGQAVYSNDARNSNAKNHKPNSSGGAQPGSKKPTNLPPLPVQQPGPAVEMDCILCNGKHTSLLYCKKFQKCRVKDRWELVKEAKTCFRCLRLDSKFDPTRRPDWFKSHEGACSADFICTEGPCGKKPAYKQLHFVLCYNHINTNKTRQDDLIATMDPPTDGQKYRFYLADMSDPIFKLSDPTKMNNGIPFYLVHYYRTHCGKKFLSFYDNGCQAAGVSSEMADPLKAIVVRPGPTKVDVAGGSSIINPHGDVEFELALANGGSETVRALQMDSISCPFPTWQLTQAWEYIIHVAQSNGVNTDNFPTVPNTVGGEAVGLMLGVKYLGIHPVEVYKLPSGLTLYTSALQCADGHQGVLGGPQPAFEDAAQSMKVLQQNSYLSDEINAFSTRNFFTRSTFYDSGPVDELSLLPKDKLDSEIYCTCDVPEYESSQTAACYRMAIRDLKSFKSVEDLGSTIEYRCVTCRVCNKCKQGELLEKVSLVEENQQALLELCVTHDVENKVVISKLPFIVDPDEKLGNNHNVAKKILESQLRNIDKKPEIRADVLRAHDKLLLNGHVIPVSELPPELQEEVRKGKYKIPWRFVHNAGSLSTPCRLVFDGSSKSPTGWSLNDCLATGTNTLATLLHLVFQFRTGEAAFASDISMAYNAIKLHPSHYKYQKYYWVPGLEGGSENMVEMVIKTLIYGIRPSGNLTIAAFRAVAAYARTQGRVAAIGADVLEKKSYMDDVFPSFANAAERDEAITGLLQTLSYGSMTVKAVTKSGEDPPDEVSNDGVSIGIVGYRWMSKSDEMRLDIKPLAFGKMKRGVRPAPVEGDVREALLPVFTKRIICGQVAGIFDPAGIASPVVGRLKADLSHIFSLQTDWDDPLPVEYMDQWLDNFEAVQQLNELTFPRNSCPVGIGELELVACADSSQELAAIAIYSRVETSPGIFECHLITAKTSVVTKLTVPKGEMRAATMLAQITAVVKRNMTRPVSKVTYITDSTIVLHWLSSDDRPLMVGVRNCCIEIRRHCSPTDWRHVPSADNPADIATRRGPVSEILGHSEWLRGKEWMCLPEDKWPTRTISEIQLTNEEKIEAGKEIRNSNLRSLVLLSKVDDIKQRYEVAKYLIDPAGRYWPNFVRRQAVVYRCAMIWLEKTRLGTRSKSFANKNPVMRVQPFQQPSDDKKPIISILPTEVEAALHSVFVKTTIEVKKFQHKTLLEKIGVEKDGVILYAGRIPVENQPKSLIRLSFDLLPRNFASPVVDPDSPVALAVMLYVHRTLTRHGGVTNMVRRSMEIVYIIRGRALAIAVREDCLHCKRYKPKVLEASLAPVHKHRLLPSPAFYHVEVDLYGPYSASCEHNHRSTVKVWGCIFKCKSTMSIWVEAMPGYSVAHFVHAYIRFSCKWGHAGILYIDAGSQLVAAAKKMKINIDDYTKGINGRYGVSIEYVICVVGAHQQQGMSERGIKECRRFFNAVFRGFKFDILTYSTAFAFISNEINCIPIGLLGRYSNLGSLELLTPARLLMGRNNQRSPVGLVEIAGASRLIKQLDELRDAWWQVWDSEFLISLIPQKPGWNPNDPDVRVQDIVIFKRSGNDGKIGTVWRTGRVIKLHRSEEDNVLRAVTIEYRNPDEVVYRETKRSVRTLAVLQDEDHLDLTRALNDASREADIHYIMTTPIEFGGTLGMVIHRP